MSDADRELPPHRYTAPLAAEIESRWQSAWDRSGVHAASNPGEPGFDGTKPKVFVLDMFPYPSGAGLHVGHPLGYIATDIFARYQRMLGKNVLHAMGFDSFGLPAEQYAIDTGTHPRVTTEKNVETFRRQLRRLGLGHDARRGVSTTDLAFYRWTQWIFLQIYNAWYDPEQGRARRISELVEQFERGVRTAGAERKPWSKMNPDERAEVLGEHRLAFLADVDVNWCPALGTVLANEEVTADGRSERGNHPVFKRPLRQWMMRITSYADRLLADLAHVNWPEPIRQMQRNWIGKSEGAFIDFVCGTRKIRVFTTRPDTMMGATYLVLSPEHPLVDHLSAEKWGPTTPDDWKGLFPGAEALRDRQAGPRETIESYRAYAATKSDRDRGADTKEKTGVFIGAFAVNPLSGARVPVFIADYVLMGYGTGAIMAVPAHDERDFEFAKQFALPIRDVVYPRTVLAMRYYCAEATEQERKGEGWFGTLADFLGLVTSRDIAPDGFAEALAQVRARPRDAGDDPASTALEARQAFDDVPGAIGRRRGVTRLTWLDAIEALGFDSFDDFRGWFAEAAFYSRTGAAFSGEGFAANSGVLDGLPTSEAKVRAGVEIEAKGAGKRAVQYRLRDWLFSRQRYWGEPFPIVYEEGDARGDRPIALPESMLPVELPDVDEYKPVASDDPSAPPQPPLGRARQWMHVQLDLGQGVRRYRRELNTMPQWAGSCWYYLRYLDPENDGAFVGPEVERYWMLTPSAGAEVGASGSRKGFDPARDHWGGVDLYVGGAEHAVLHLLYARFWHKVLFDLGHVSTPEPFGRLFNQGYIQAPAFKDDRGVYVEASRVVEEPAGSGVFAYEGRPVRREFGKMGKSLKNVITPDDVCDEFGADTMRLYEMYMGPLEQSKPWNPRDIVGVHRFLQRVWRSMVDEETGALRAVESPMDDASRRMLHKAIEGVRRDFEGLSFNTAIAKLIELNNFLAKAYADAPLPMEAARAMVLMLSPLTPHIAEELWSRLHGRSAGAVEAGGAWSVVRQRFPEADPALLVEDSIEIPVQILGKVRSKIVVAAGADEATIRDAALSDDKVRAFLEGKTVQKTVVVPGRMVNIVAK